MKRLSILLFALAMLLVGCGDWGTDGSDYGYQAKFSFRYYYGQDCSWMGPDYLCGDAYSLLPSLTVSVKVDWNGDATVYYDGSGPYYFWKDEYDVVAAATAAAAGAELGEMDLSMPGLETVDAGSSTEFSMGDDAPFLEKSPEDAGVPEEKGPKFGSGFEFVNQEPAEETSGSVDASAPETTAFESLAAEASNADDPFAALSALIPDSDAGDEAAMDSLQASLDSAMESINADEPSAPEVFPADDDISGGDVNSAMSNFFGVDDDLEPEEPAAPASPFSNLNLSAGIDDEPAAAENANKVFSTPAPEDKPQSVDDAFGSIFGEDELPEEPTATAAPAADKPQSIDDAFGDIFGEDELPEEPAAFQKSAEVEPPAEVEPAVAESAPAAPAADRGRTDGRPCRS